MLRETSNLKLWSHPLSRQRMQQSGAHVRALWNHSLGCLPCNVLLFKACKLLS